MDMQKLSVAIETIRGLHVDQNYQKNTMSLYRQSANRILNMLSRSSPSLSVCDACLALLHAWANHEMYLNPVDQVQLRLVVSYLETGHPNRNYLRARKGNIPKSKQFKRCHKDFLYWLTKQGKSIYTIESYRNVVAQFLNHLSDCSCYELSRMHSSHINTFFMKLSQNWALTSIRVASSAIKSFLVYLNLGPEFYLALPRHCPKHTPIIPILTKNEDELVKGYLQNESASYRSRSIIGLCYYLGIRAIDITNLRFSDIDWNKDVISFRQSKTRGAVILPLVPIVGNCIAKYITLERPESKYQAVFLTEFAPRTPLSEHTAIYKIIANAFKELGIREHQMQGSHLLRHNAATKQIACGTPVGTISTLLGHSQIETTTIYLTTDFESMRQCCLDPIFRLRRSSK